MAQRYGGKYSPTASEDEGRITVPTAASYHGSRVDPAGARVNLLFIPPVVLIATTLTGGATEAALGLAGAAVLGLGNWLLRDGLRAEDEYNHRKVARRPAIPRKIFASVLTGLGTGLAAFVHEPSLLAAGIFAVIGGALHSAAFGIDPLRSKGMEGIDTFQQDRVAQVVKGAESTLVEMADAVRRAGDRQVEARVERFAGQVREMLRTVEEDPRDLTAARKFLGVYLRGARDAAVKYADIYSRSRSAGARSDFMMLLTDLEESFGAKRQKLLLDDHTDLTIEIDVLRDRLAREGVRIDS